MKKTFSILLLFFLALEAIAPTQKFLFISEADFINPFDKLIFAVGMVEVKGDTLAYNEVEKAAGFFQIRPIRLEDYNKRTGNHYTMQDMFNFEISKKVFIYYASQIGPYDLEKIARNWNGSGVKTILYWKKIKAFL